MRLPRLWRNHRQQFGVPTGSSRNRTIPLTLTRLEPRDNPAIPVGLAVPPPSTLGAVDRPLPTTPRRTR